MEEKEIAELIGVKEVIDANSQIIINGIPQQQKVYLLHCPKCGRVVYQFNHPELTMVNVYKVCTEQEPALLDVATYCPKCGQKLRYAREVIEESVPVTVESGEE